MKEIHEGGCLCGAVRFRTTGQPFRTSACHCTFCQRRTGSVLGLFAYFKADQVELNGAPLTMYEHRSDESGRRLRVEFCPTCGTPVTHTAELWPGGRGISAGAFDDPKWFKVDRHIWLRSKHPWFELPAGVEAFDKAATPPAAAHR
jgi:hypothetical protein